MTLLLSADALILSSNTLSRDVKSDVVSLIFPEKLEEKEYL
jgi:hypothetical protein